MNARAQVAGAETHACPRCGDDRPTDQFRRSSPYCLDCSRAYQRERYQAIRAGNWNPRVKTGAQRLQALATSATIPTPVPVLSVEEGLCAAMAAFMRERGFTALRAAMVRFENELARTKRIELAAEGWII